MREIIFRGKSVDNGKWVYGYVSEHTICGEQTTIEIVIEEKPKHIYDCETHIVQSETLCQYTGLTDKNGTKIFEGDIVNYFNKDYLNHEIIFSKGCFMFRFISEYVQKIRRAKQEPIFSNVSVCGEVIGNIFDNPELMEV